MAAKTSYEGDSRPGNDPRSGAFLLLCGWKWKDGRLSPLRAQSKPRRRTLYIETSEDSLDRRRAHGNGSSCGSCVAREPDGRLRNDRLDDERRDRRAAGQLAEPLRGLAHRDEPRGAHRSRARRVLLDGAVRRARARRDAADRAAHLGDRHVPAGRGHHDASRSRSRAPSPASTRTASQQAAQTAKENCPVSKALAGVPEISLEARLG